MITQAQAKKIMKLAGVQRIGTEAAKALAEHLSELGVDLSKKALSLAMHARRKTVSREDVKLAIKGQ